MAWAAAVACLLGGLTLGTAPRTQAQGTGSNVQIFGPKKYVRTTGAPNQYTDKLTVPAWVVSPYKLHIQNGEPGGANRVSSATIKINGKTVVKQSDFNQNVATIDRNVTLAAQTTLQVTLASKPGSFLIVNLAGANGDRTPPVLAVEAPAEGQALATATPVIEIAYNDPRGSGEPAASGVDTASLQVLLDGTDRTDVFEVRTDGASATLPPELALSEGTHTLEVTVADFAGNAREVTRTFVVDTVPPTIAAASAPPPNAAGWNHTGVTVSFTCEDTGSGVATCPEAKTVTAEGADQEITGTATDKAGNTASASVTVSLDKTPPAVTAAVSPSPNAAGWNVSDVTVTFACTDALSGVAICPAPVVVSAEGAGQAIEGTAEDAAGNTASASVTVNLSKTPPSIAAAVSPAPNAAGWNHTDVTVAFLCTPGGAPIVSCPPPQGVSSEGDNQQITGTARDAADATATATATVRLDKTPPSITQLVTPERLAPGGTGTVSAVVADNQSIAAVAFLVNGETAATLIAPPYQLELTVPEGARTGDTLTVTAVVSDPAGNTATASRGVTVAAQGVVVGQVLADATGLPLPGAAVQVVDGTQQDVADGRGRYSLLADTSHLILRIAKPDMLPVEREVAVQPGVGTVAVDARLTAAAGPVPIDSGGGTLTAGDVTVAVPPGGVAAPTPFRLTRRSGQGLPALLPLGWSPVAAFDLSADGAAAGPFTASFAGVPQNQALQLAAYDTGAHAWTLTERDLTSPDGALTAVLPAPGSYALVLADATEPPLAVPDPGQPLPGAAMVLLPPDAASSGALAPASLPPAGGTAMATLAVHSSVPLPSGTVIQANVTELYTPSSGEPISEAARTEDLVLYRYQAPAGAALVAPFPVTPSRTFEAAELQSGKVHLDILAGREGVRGQTGGSGAVVVQSGDASLAIAAGSLPQDTAIALFPVPLADFLPAGNGLAPLAQYVLDFSGRVLSQPAQLSAGAAGAGTPPPGGTLLLAQIQRFDGVPRLVAVSLAQVSGGQIVSQPYPGLPGITEGGEYVFYRSEQPLGFVAGLVSAGGGPVSALVQTDALPFVTLSDLTGRYTLPALPGTANVKATVPQTALLATGSAAVTAGQTAALDLALAGSVSAATVQPPDGALGVDPNAGITITAAVAVNPETVTAANVQLLRVESAGNQPVAVRFVLAQGNRQVSVFPLAALQPSTRYTLQVSGLASAVGGLVAVPSVTFTTRAVTPPNFNVNALVFSFPDANGNVQVSAPAGSFPPGTTVLILDQTNGVVLSLTVDNNGAVSGQLPATIDDLLVVTVTAPDKTTSTFTRSQFVAPDGSVAVGAGGGTVTGPGGVELRIPEGALDRAVTLKIEAFGPDLFPERPDLPDGNFGSGLKITASRAATFKKEVELAFPKPADAPEGSFFYVYRRAANADGSVSFETIDHAFVQGSGEDAKVVTASPPFSGVIDVMQQSYHYLLWTIDRLLPGTASTGLIVGKVVRTIPPPPGGTEPTFKPIANARAWQTSDSAQKTVARSNESGIFTLFDPTVGGGTRRVTVELDTGERLEGTAFELNAFHPDDVFFGISPQLYLIYRNVGRVTLTFPPAQPAPPVPELDIWIFQRDASGKRVDAGGLVPSGTALVIGLKSNGVSSADLRSLAVAGQQLPFSPNDTGTPKMDFIATQDFIAPQPGTYTISATALPVFGGSPITVSRSFRVIAAGGSNNEPDPSQPPGVVSELPRTHSILVPTTIFPQVVFSEPVRNLPGNVTLKSESGQPVDFTLSGVGRPGADGTLVVFENLTDPAAVVTSVTLQPKQGLSFGTRYILSLGPGIVDLDDPQPRSIVADPVDFTTVSPRTLASTDEVFPSPRVVVLGDFAYLTRLTGVLVNELRVYNVKDPSVLAAPLGSVGVPGGRPIDLAGEESSPANNDRAVVAVATGIPGGGLDSEVARTVPSQVLFYDVSKPPKFSLLGKVELTSSATQEGTPLRMVMFKGAAYVATFQKGIQIVRLRDALGSQGGHSSQLLVQTIPVTRSSNGLTIPVVLFDLKAGDYVVGQQSKTLVFATGHTGLVVADPAASPAVLFQDSLDGAGGGALLQGTALALGTVNDKKVALVVGQGAGIDPATGSVVTGPVLAVVDLSNPGTPRPVSFLALPEAATDVVVREADALALIGLSDRTLLVSLQDLARPRIAGEINEIGGRLTLSSSNVLFSTGYGASQGGIHTASFGSACAAFRALLQTNPPKQEPIDSAPRLEWSISGGVSDLDGLVLSDVKLGRRLLATKMSLPYLDLVRTDSRTGNVLRHRCELMPTSDSACTGASPARGRLLRFTNIPPIKNEIFFAIEAQYLFDRFDGDADVNPELPDSCLVLTQRYEFHQEGVEPVEPFGQFPAARFRPLVKYSYFTDNAGPKLESVTTAQRLVFDARNSLAPDAKAPANATLLGCDFGPNPLNFLNLSKCVPSAPNGSILGLFGGHNPLPHEVYLTVIHNGESKANEDPDESVIALDRFVDHYHSSPHPVAPPEDWKIDEPGFTEFGCPGCVHVHWRWSWLFSLDPGFLIDPAFQNNGGELILPPGSNQDVAIAIDASGTEHPDRQTTVEDLVRPRRSILPSALGETKPAFWYVATGHKNSDEFFLHGGGFGTFYVNKISVPRSGPLALQIEHTRDLEYEINITERVQIDRGIVAFPRPAFQCRLPCKLPAGQDDIAVPSEIWSGWDPLTTRGVDVAVVLIDPALAQPSLGLRSKYVRTFTFSDPEEREP